MVSTLDLYEENGFNFYGKPKKTRFSYLPNRFQWENMMRESIIEILLSRFEWGGLPENMPEYYLERILIMYGKAAMINHKTDGFIVARGSTDGLNHYEKPTHFNVVSPTMTGRFDLYGDDIVLVENNSTGTSDMEIINNYIKVLGELMVTKGVNLQTLKTPFLLKGDEKTRNSLYEALNQITFGESHIMLDGKFAKGNPDAVDVLNLNSPYHLDKLHADYERTRNELLELLGINTNPNPEKKERMITGEVNANNQEVEMARVTRFKLRERAAEEASKKFGRKITVKMREEFTNAATSLPGVTNSPGYDNGDDQGGSDTDTIE